MVHLVSTVYRVEHKNSSHSFHLKLDTVATIYYTTNRGCQAQSLTGLMAQLTNTLKGYKQMTPTDVNATTKKVTRTVFDLTLFDDQKLTKDVPLPAKPASLDEALNAVGRDETRLLKLVYEGLVAETVNAAWEDISGYLMVDENGKPGEAYKGNYADEEKGDKINAAILAIAKMQGYDKSLSREKKRELKEAAQDFLKSNPAMLASIQGVSAKPAEPSAEPTQS